MAKTKKIQTETIETTTTIDHQLDIDKVLIIKLRRVTRPIQSEMDEIYYLYTKYINKDAQAYCATCNGGPLNSIIRYYWSIVALDENNLKPL